MLLENYKVGTLEKYGLGYAALSAINPKLIYCSITGFGQTGPYSARPGYDTIVQAMGGLMSITGQPDGAPGAGPVRVGIALTDTMTALYATIAVQAALLRREHTGRGEYIDLSLLDVQVSALSAVAMNFLVSGKVPTRRGNRLPTVYPSDTFRCEDGYLMLIVGNDQQFRRLCSTTGLGPTTSRFGTNAMRVEHATHSRSSSARSSGQSPCASGSTCSRRRRCRAHPSTTSHRCSKIRRFSRAACVWSFRIRFRAACPALRIRSGSETTPCNPIARRPR